MVVADIDDDDAARYVRKHRPRKINDYRLRQSQRNARLRLSPPGVCPPLNGFPSFAEAVRKTKPTKITVVSFEPRTPVTWQDLASAALTGLGGLVEIDPGVARSLALPWAIIFRASALLHMPGAESLGYFSNFGSAGFIWSHGCASDVHTSTSGLNQLGSSRLAVLIAAN